MNRAINCSCNSLSTCRLTLPVCVDPILAAGVQINDADDCLQQFVNALPSTATVSQTARSIQPAAPTSASCAERASCRRAKLIGFLHHQHVGIENARFDRRTSSPSPGAHDQSRAGQLGDVHACPRPPSRSRSRRNRRVGGEVTSAVARASPPKLPRVAMDEHPRRLPNRACEHDHPKLRRL